MNLIVVRGRKLQIEWATTRTGKVPAREFFMGLSGKEKAGILALFRRLADFGRIQNTQHFKKVRDDLWEFKKSQIRLLGGFRPGGRFVLALGLKKKDDKHKPKDLKKAEKILEEIDLY